MPSKNYQNQARVFIDCDSTIATIEGYDELAKIVHHHTAVVRITNKTMNQGGNFKTSVIERLNLIKPNLDMISDLSKAYIKNIVPGIKTAIAQLNDLGLNPTIVSAGPKAAIIPLAVYLNIKVQNVYAIDMDFSKDGNYLGISKENVLFKTNGKIKLCQKLCKNKQIGIIVGDGMNDIVTKEKNMYFIQYAGVVDRKKVSKYATSKITSKSLKTLPTVISNLINEVGGKS